MPMTVWLYDSGSVLCRWISSALTYRPEVWERPNFYSSASSSCSLDAGLEASALTKEEIDVFDFYSSVPFWAFHSVMETHVGIQLLPHRPQISMSPSGTSADIFPEARHASGRIDIFRWRGQQLFIACKLNAQALRIHHHGLIHYSIGSNCDGATNERRPVSYRTNPCERRSAELSTRRVFIYQTRARKPCLPYRESPPWVR